MRIVFAAGLAGLALVSLTACNKSAPASGDASSGAVAAAPASGPVTLDQIPHRSPGLWSQTIATDGAPAGPGAMQLCVDAASEAKMSVLAQHIQGAHCTPPQFTRNLDGSLAFSESCDMGTAGKIQTTGVMKGDFNSSYTTTMSSTTSGSSIAALNGAHTMVITATRTGPCAPGQKGGDMILANGMVVHAQGAAAPGGQ
jgi:hypothetical protein